MADDDLIELRDDTPASADLDASTPWRILIVDDDEQVHQVTRFALQGVRILGRRLLFDSAYSAAEARRLLRQQRYSCILLDVVMESEDAGLKLVGEIRERFEDPAVRIVLRTGQPGYAPEIEVIESYDINDYRAKSELTSQRLLTSLTAALRSYQQICTIEANRAGLQRVLDAATGLMAVRAVHGFAERVLLEVCGILDVPAMGVLCGAADESGELRVLASVGPAPIARGLAIDALEPPERRQRIERVFASRSSEIGADAICLFLQSPRIGVLAVDVPTSKPISELDRRLLELYAINVAVGLDNAHLFEELELYAFHDALTGLWNRTSLERELKRRAQQDEHFVLVLVDIDNFQAVNDGLGHEIGDRTLKAAATVLSDVFGISFLARTAADNFALVLGGEVPLEARLLALQQRLERNIQVDDHEVPMSMTFGVARFPQHGGTAGELFRNAGMALKQAKRLDRGGFRYFDNGYEAALRQRLTTIRELRPALGAGQLKLHYQSQVALAGGGVIGAEALLRWQRSPSQLVTPDAFIAAAEESGQIVAIGAFVLDQACRQQVAWMREHGVDVGVAVNVSPRQLKDPGFTDVVVRALERSGIRPERLELEVTESLLLDEGDRASDILREVRATGVRIAIDDFGMGHSSLSRLQRLPLDRLKIDRSFVTDIEHRQENRVIVDLVVKLGHALGLKVLAEGVESAEQARILLELGCDEAQGYWFGRPQPPASWIAAGRPAS